MDQVIQGLSPFYYLPGLSYIWGSKIKNDNPKFEERKKTSKLNRNSEKNVKLSTSSSFFCILKEIWRFYYSVLRSNIIIVNIFGVFNESGAIYIEKFQYVLVSVLFSYICFKEVPGRNNSTNLVEQSSFFSLFLALEWKTQTKL